MPHDQFGFMPSKQNCLNIRKSVSVIYHIREVKRISYDCQINEFGRFQCPLSVEAFPDQIINHSTLTMLGLSPEMGYGTGGGHGSSEVSDSNSRKSRNTPRAAEVPGKHWQESGSPGPTEEGPLAHRLTRGPPPSSPWERTRALTVRRETGCWESLIPAGGGTGARRASRGSPAPPSPGGQLGLREPSGLPHPWDIPSEGQLGPWTEQALKSHIRTHTYALTWDNGHVNVVPQVTSNSLNPTPVSV